MQYIQRLWIDKKDQAFHSIAFNLAQLNEQDHSYERIKYALQVLYGNVSRFIITTIIAIIFNCLFEFLFFSLIYCLIRRTSFGFHVSSPLLCTILGSIQYFGSIILSNYLNLPTGLYTILFCIMLFIYMKYAPAQSKYQRFMKSKTKWLKIQSCGTVILLYLSHYLIQSKLGPVYSNLVLLAVLCGAMNILPLSFKIFEKKETMVK